MSPEGRSRPQTLGGQATQRIAIQVGGRLTSKTSAYRQYPPPAKPPGESGASSKGPRHLMGPACVGIDVSAPAGTSQRPGAPAGARGPRNRRFATRVGGRLTSKPPPTGRTHQPPKPRADPATSPERGPQPPKSHGGRPTADDDRRGRDHARSADVDSNQRATRVQGRLTSKPRPEAGAESRRTTGRVWPPAQQR